MIVIESTDNRSIGLPFGFRGGFLAEGLEVELKGFFKEFEAGGIESEGKSRMVMLLTGRAAIVYIEKYGAGDGVATDHAFIELWFDAEYVEQLPLPGVKIQPESAARLLDLIEKIKPVFECLKHSVIVLALFGEHINAVRHLFGNADMFVARAQERICFVRETAGEAIECFAARDEKTGIHKWLAVSGEFAGDFADTGRLHADFAAVFGVQGDNAISFFERCALEDEAFGFPGVGHG